MEDELSKSRLSLANVKLVKRIILSGLPEDYVSISRESVYCEHFAPRSSRRYVTVFTWKTEYDVDKISGPPTLSEATRLAQTGHHVSIYERKPDLEEVGAGIQ